jgi:hypothetical protein
MSTHESWKKAAHALVQHWRANGPTASPQWCSDAARLIEFAEELMDTQEPPDRERRSALRIAADRVRIAVAKVKQKGETMSEKGMTLTVLATGLAEAVAKDEKEIADGHPDCGFDLSAGMFGAHVSVWLREVAAALTEPK